MTLKSKWQIHHNELMCHVWYSLVFNLLSLNGGWGIPFAFCHTLEKIMQNVLIINSSDHLSVINYKSAQSTRAKLKFFAFPQIMMMTSLMMICVRSDALKDDSYFFTRGKIFSVRCFSNVCITCLFSSSFLCSLKLNTTQFEDNVPTREKNSLMWEIKTAEKREDISPFNKLFHGIKHFITEENYFQIFFLRSHIRYPMSVFKSYVCLKDNGLKIWLAWNDRGIHWIKVELRRAMEIVVAIASDIF